MPIHGSMGALSTPQTTNLKGAPTIIGTSIAEVAAMVRSRSITCATPAGTQSGDLMIAFLVSSDSKLTNTWASVPAGWSEIGYTTINPLPAPSTGYPGPNIAVAMATVVGNPAANYTFTVSASDTYYSIGGGAVVIVTVRNAKADVLGAFNPSGDTSVVITGPVTATALSINVSAANSLVFAFFAADEETPGLTLTPPTGYTALTSWQNPEPTIMLAYTTAGVGATGNVSFTFPYYSAVPVTNWGGVLLSLVPG